MTADSLLAISEANITNVLVAVVGLVGVLGAAWASVRAAREARMSRQELKAQVAEVSSAVATNHGLRPGEYLEQIADVRTELGIHGAAMDARLDSILRVLGEHTLEDQMRFDELHRALKVGRNRMFDDGVIDYGPGAHQ